MKEIAPADFIDGNNRRVLTDVGEPGLDGMLGQGSSTELAKAAIAAAICQHGWKLADFQLDEIINWINLYRR